VTVPGGGRPLHIGVDVGTSGCKAIVLDPGGRVVHAAVAAYATRQGVDGEVTQDPGDWLVAVRRTLRACAAAVDPAAVAGIGVTAPAHVGVLTGADGNPLTRSLLAFDGRPGSVVPGLRERYGQAFFATTFVDLSAGWTLPQLIWLRTQAPEVWPRIRWLLTQKDWIRFRLTGVPLIDASDAAGTAMVDQRARAWLEPVCRDAGLGPDQLPPIVSSTAPGGGLTRAWARATGLRPGTPVVVGATDTAAELVSVGALSGGTSLVKIASTGTVVGVSAEPVTERRLLTYPHAVPGLWYTLAATNTAAVAYHWLRETVFAAPAASPRVAYAEMDRCASRVPAGADGVLFLPFLEGERTPYWDPDLRAAFLGMSSGHRRDHLARAVLEGVAFALRGCRDVVRGAGLPVDRPFLAGGGMASRLWRTILVSALGQEGRLADPQGPAVGAAVLAAAVGAEDPAAVRSRAPRAASVTVRPRADWAETYDELSETYRIAASAVNEVSHRLASMSRGRR
jgi:xylulokinase